MSAPVDVLAVRRWVAELAVSANGMHEIREGAANERDRPLVGYAATYEQASAIADAHNNSAAVAELIEAAAENRAAHDALAADSIGARKVYERADIADARLDAALARVKGVQS